MHPKLPVAIVYWLDAAGDQDRIDPDEIEAKHRPLPAVSAGILLKNDKAGITMATDAWCDENGLVHTYGSVNHIPRSMIVKVRHA